MTSVIEVEHLTKRYGDTLAVDDVSLAIEKDAIYGLLGRNGAGKTTLMSILTAQGFATSGSVSIFGQRPYENAAVLQRMCFVREGQKYPDDAKPGHAFRMARLFFPNWDQDVCDSLVAQFQLPMNRTIKKLSRGQLSAVGVVIGLASRAEITFFDEPYLGLDAVARQIFYDRLLEDYAEHPRTVLLSSHLIDEVANLLERVVVIDAGRIVMDAETDAVRDLASTVVGDADAVERFVVGREVLHRESLGRVASVTVLGTLTDADRRALAEARLDVAPVSLQQLVVRTTQAAARRRAAGDTEAGAWGMESARDAAAEGAADGGATPDTTRTAEKGALR
ncbi:ABC transporter ATP-binding protein [Miniimonas sp. S16]|uniref:ABC transporter ATP-binding protein n=1 Tax=Miniimonas sp. S16 TaxID=2171623 RepID=UPI000D529AA1|nr:ABC transporter ATP-binding protein [Miniimonas sp. S16]